MQTPTPQYTLTRRSRMKNLRIRVLPEDGSVAVSAPHWAPRSTIDEFVAGRSEWIAAQRAHLETLPPPIQPGPEAERLRAELDRRVVPMLDAWTERMGLMPVPDYRIRRMKTRWGTCNARARRITFGLELARRSDAQLEYVVVHELAHLIASHHGPEFQSVMDSYLPQWRRIQRELNARVTATREE